MKEAFKKKREKALFPEVLLAWAPARILAEVLVGITRASLTNSDAVLIQEGLRHQPSASWRGWSRRAEQQTILASIWICRDAAIKDIMTHSLRCSSKTKQWFPPHNSSDTSLRRVNTALQVKLQHDFRWRMRNRKKKKRREKDKGKTKSRQKDIFPLTVVRPTANIYGRVFRESGAQRVDLEICVHNHPHPQRFGAFIIGVNTHLHMPHTHTHTNTHFGSGHNKWSCATTPWTCSRTTFIIKKKKKKSLPKSLYINSSQSSFYCC